MYAPTQARFSLMAPGRACTGVAHASCRCRTRAGVLAVTNLVPVFGVLLGQQQGRSNRGRPRAIHASAGRRHSGSEAPSQ